MATPLNERMRLLIAEVRKNVVRLGCGDCEFYEDESNPPPWRLESKDARDNIESALAMMEFELDTPTRP